MIDNFTYIRGSHSYKFGFDWQHIYDERTAAPQFVYTFPTIAAYLAAKTGANPFGYTTMTQITGDLAFNMSTNIFSTFVQDDWQIAPTVKLLYGVRYDLYKYPEGLAGRAARADARASTSTRTTSARASAWRGRSTRQTVVRASTGIMYDQAILGGYEQALQMSGSPRAPVYTFSGTSAGRAGVSRHAPAPARSRSSRRGRSIRTFRWRTPGRSNVQVERAFGSDFTASVGVMYAIIPLRRSRIRQGTWSTSMNTTG